MSDTKEHIGGMTDKEVFYSKSQTVQDIKAGRPETNRDLGYTLLKSGKTTKTIMRIMKCSSKTVRRMREELEEKGELKPIQKLDLEGIDRDFEEETKEVMGYGFYEWLTSCTKAAKSVFNFCEKSWSDIMGRPSLHIMADRTQQLGDQTALKFMQAVGSDTQRIRRRIKYIRHLYTFLGREDVNNKHLKISRSRHPEEIREVPEITFKDFPKKLGVAMDIFREKFNYEIGGAAAEEAALLLKIKLVSQMRTGEGERELWGVRVKETNHSYLIMQTQDEFAFKVHAKGNETWNISWIPAQVRADLWRLYEGRTKGEKLIKLPVDMARKFWREATLEAGLPALSLHDLRKVSITWFWIMGIPLEIATSLNCGWRDLNTARDHYLQYRQMLKKDVKNEYKANIPEWFKEGLDQYTGK